MRQLRPSLRIQSALIATGSKGVPIRVLLWQSVPVKTRIEFVPQSSTIPDDVGVGPNGRRRNTSERQNSATAIDLDQGPARVWAAGFLIEDCQWFPRAR